MQPVPRGIANKFAGKFAGKGRGSGMTAKEITEFFLKYNLSVKAYEHYGIRPSKHELFVETLYTLSPREQYYSLTDLTRATNRSLQALSEAERKNLRDSLHQCFSRNPIGLSFSSLNETAFREDWYTAYLRVRSSPAAAVTAARTLLETVLKTIISERNGAPDNSGDLGRLLKQSTKQLNWSDREDQAIQQITSGLGNMVNGICAISNASGDRHGIIDGMQMDDPSIAELVVNACGTIGILMIELHLFRKQNPERPGPVPTGEAG